MAIEDDEPKDREVWSNVAKFWYNKASDKSPAVGRLYHHLAILARPYTLEQLSLYARSLTCIAPFESAKGSIMTLFNPVLHGKESGRRSASFETVFIRIHALLFTIKSLECYERLYSTISELVKENLFRNYIVQAKDLFKEIGVFIAVSNIAALFEFGSAQDGSSKSRLRVAFEKAQKVKDEGIKPTPADSNDPTPLPQSSESIDALTDNPSSANLDEPPTLIAPSSRLTSITFDVCLRTPENVNVYPFVHVYLSFLWSLILVQQACRYFDQDPVLVAIEREVPWIAICSFLNHLAADPQIKNAKVRRPQFPKSTREGTRPLPEDFILRGQLYTQWLFPRNWFSAAIIDDDERSLDPPSMALSRKERVLWLGHRIATVCLFPNVLGESLIFIR